MHSYRIIVRSTNWIGDALMTTPALHNLRQAYPEAYISLIVKPWVRPVFEHNPDVDELVVYNPAHGLRRLKSFFDMVETLKSNRFDLAIAFQNAIEAALLFYKANIPRRVGYATDLRNIFLTDKVKISKSLLEKHQVHYYNNILSYLGVDMSPGRLVLQLTDEERNQAVNILKSYNVSEERTLIGLNPGATFGSAKRWYPERFAGVGAALMRLFDANLVLFGTENEKEMADQIETRMTEKPLNLCGRTTLRELAALLAHCQMLVTNDSGAMHVAAAVGTPIVAIFGPTDPRTTAPWSVPHRIVTKSVECSPCLLRECPIDHRCMEQINVDDVVEAVTENL